MTEIRPAGSAPISPSPLPGLTPKPPEVAGGEQERSSTQVSISAAGVVDAERQQLRLAQELAQQIVVGLRSAQQGLAQVADRWRGGRPGPEELREPAGQVLEAAGSSYRGVQPLMQAAALTVGPYVLQGYQLVGELIPMQALLPDAEAPQAINQAWLQTSEALQQAVEQRDRLDAQLMTADAPETPPGQLPDPQAGLHRLPALARIVELLR